MSRSGRVPLAWKNLTHNVWRLLIAVSGVTFAVVLMFMEKGYQDALLNSPVSLLKKLDADILMVSGARQSLAGTSRFSQNEIALARNCVGVESVQPLYLEKISAVIRKPNFTSRPIRVIAYDVHSRIFTDELQEALDRNRDQLLAPRNALIDVMTKTSIYGVSASEVSQTRPMELELANQRIRLTGTFRLGTDFVNDGNLIMGLGNFGLYFPFRGGYGGDPLAAVDLGLVKCGEDQDPEEVIQKLQNLLGENVSVCSRAAFVARETSVWRDNTPIGAIFKVGMIMGFVVGILICYQVLFNDIMDHMAEFATLKAMGYSGGYFVSLVVRESVYLSLFGFVPGVLISWFLFKLTTILTGLTMALTLGGIAFTLVLTLAMCVLSGLLAVRKLMAADPASLF
jgi:putative ABC transport system permease protein